MQTELEYTARFPESLYEPLIWDLGEASVQIFSWMTTSLIETTTRHDRNPLFIVIPNFELQST